MKYKKSKIGVKSAPGFALIEVLTALFILTAALLGLALLLISVTQHSRELVLQMQALWYVEDMLERMRANPGLDYAIAYEATPQPVADCARALCSPEQMALFEVASWKCLLAGTGNERCHRQLTGLREAALCQRWQLPEHCHALPGGDGRIAVSGRRYRVSVRWQSQHSQSAPFSEITMSTRI